LILTAWTTYGWLANRRGQQSVRNTSRVAQVLNLRALAAKAGLENPAYAGTDLRVDRMWLYLAEFVAAIICVAWQYAWPAWLRLGGQTPDLAVALIISVGLTRGMVEGCWTGLGAGWLVGSLGSMPLGGIFVSHLGLGTLAGLLRGRIFSDRIVVAMLVTFGAVLVANFVELIFYPPPAFLAWLTGTVVQALLSGLAAAPLFAVVRATVSRIPSPRDA